MRIAESSRKHILMELASLKIENELLKSSGRQDLLDHPEEIPLETLKKIPAVRALLDAANKAKHKIICMDAGHHRRKCEYCDSAEKLNEALKPWLTEGD